MLIRCTCPAGPEELYADWRSATVKKTLLMALVISLIVAGLLAIIAMLGGNLGGSVRILFTTLAFTVYSLIGLCCVTLLTTKYKTFAQLGLMVTGVGLVYAVITTWVTPNSLGFLAARFAFLVVAIGFAHASLMLLIKQEATAVKAAVFISLASNLLVSILLVGMISSLDVTAGAFQTLGVVSVVGVISTIIASILGKLSHEPLNQN
jgi:hypothetical protein